jgi:hypothetical protein
MSEVSRRPLTNQDLCYVIQANGVNGDGSLKPSFTLHVGRTSADGQRVLALACGRGPEPRFVYPFLTFLPWGLAFVCQNCTRVLRAEIEGTSDAAWTEDAAPSSNTGVN